MLENRSVRTLREKTLQPCCISADSPCGIFSDCHALTANPDRRLIQSKKNGDPRVADEELTMKKQLYQKLDHERINNNCGKHLHARLACSCALQFAIGSGPHKRPHGSGSLRVIVIVIPDQ
jgi:hypothetical protein